MEVCSCVSSIFTPVITCFQEIGSITYRCLEGIFFACFGQSTTARPLNGARVQMQLPSVNPEITLLFARIANRNVHLQDDLYVFQQKPTDSVIFPGVNSWLESMNSIFSPTDGVSWTQDSKRRTLRLAFSYSRCPRSNCFLFSNIYDVSCPGTKTRVRVGVVFSDMVEELYSHMRKNLQVMPANTYTIKNLLPEDTLSTEQTIYQNACKIAMSLTY